MNNIVLLIILIIYIICSNNKKIIEGFDVSNVQSKYKNTDKYKETWIKVDKENLTKFVDDFLEKASKVTDNGNDYFSLAKRKINNELNKEYCRNKTICNDEIINNCNCNVELYKIAVEYFFKHTIMEKCFKHEKCQQGGINICEKLSIDEKRKIDKFCKDTTKEYFDKNRNYISNLRNDENINDWFNEKFQSFIEKNKDIIKKKKITEYCKQWASKSPFGKMFSENHAPKIDQLDSAWYGLKKQPTSKICAKTDDYIVGETDDKSQIAIRSDIWGKQKSIKQKKGKALEPLWTSLDDINVETDFHSSTTTTDYLNGGKCSYKKGTKYVFVDNYKCLSEHDCKKYHMEAKCVK